MEHLFLKQNYFFKPLFGFKYSEILDYITWKSGGGRIQSQPVKPVLPVEPVPPVHIKTEFDAKPQAKTPSMSIGDLITAGRKQSDMSGELEG